MSVWVVVSHNYPLNPTRQGLRFFDTKEDAQSYLAGWDGKCSAFIAEVPLVKVLNVLASSGEFSHVEWEGFIEPALPV